MSGQAEHEIYKRRGSRNRAVLWVLVAFIVLIFGATIVRLQNNPLHPFKLFWNPSHGPAVDAQKSE